MKTRMIIMTVTIGCAIMLTRSSHSARAQQNTEPSTFPAMNGVGGIGLNDNITTFIVRYGYTTKNGGKEAYPGYSDDVHGVFYKWREVIVDAKDVPNRGPFSSILPVDLDRAGLKVVVCDPPVRLIKLPSGEIAVAYYDHTNKTLFRWKGISISPPKEIPDGHSVLNLVDAAKYDVVNVSPPSLELDQ